MDNFASIFNPLGETCSFTQNTIKILRHKEVALNYSTLMSVAIDEAKLYQGATSPNPPVGAVAVSDSGEILTIQAHQKAGGPHAEVAALMQVAQQGDTFRLHTLVVTLEPCCHHGKTPPCVDAIIESRVKTVVVGARDPNPKVNGKGIEALRKAGIQVIEGICKEECENLIQSFRYWVQTGKPWIKVKTAFQENGSMLPPLGHKTFTSTESLTYAHRLRKQADAILTGSGTILSDDPQFTVRHVRDHFNKKRWLVYLDRRSRVPHQWVSQISERGFQVKKETEFEEAIDRLGSEGVHEVLVEAGPTLSRYILRKGLWNEQVVIQKRQVGEPDVQENRYRDHGDEPCLPAS